MQAKRKASLYYRNEKRQAVERFEYKTETTLLTFYRFNQITPNGNVKLGNWR